MKYVLLLISFMNFAGCYSYPTFNLREPIYLVQKPNHRWTCEKNSFASVCRRQIIDGIGMWFSHLSPEKRPRIILADEAPQKTKNEVIFIDYDRHLKTDGVFRWTLRPLTIFVKEILFGRLGYFLMAHEFGHAILGAEHKSIYSIMHADRAALKPTPADIKWLHEKHPELSR